MADEDDVVIQGDEPSPEQSDNGVKDTDPEQDIDQEPTPSA